MTRFRVLGLGAGGHAAVMVEALRAAYAGAELVGLLDPDPALAGTTVAGFEVLGGDGELGRLRAAGVSHAFVGVGAVRASDRRARCYELLVREGFVVLTVVHPAAYVSPSAQLGSGAAILPGAVVQARAELAVNVLINSRAVVEHDCRIGEHVHVASGAVLAGGVVVGPRSHVGAGAVVRERIEIGADATVGAGAVVVAPVPTGAVVVGNPARARATG